ncbi:MAG: NAD(P)H-dependent oxidoreductase subunit E [Saprospiraceae bacterium]|nr:NAD(P)H-dependent oxidoreductase subunit E [Saprospiraceae bacterium]
MSKNLTALSGRKGLTNNLFEKIGDAAAESGTLDQETIKAIADEFLMGTANIYGAASFYDFTKNANQGKKAYVCNGSACMVAGTQGKVKDALSNHYSEDEIGEMCCLGRCHENSAFHIDGHNYSGDDLQSLADLVANPVTKQDDYIGTHIGTPVLTADVQSLETLKDICKKMFDMGHEPALEEVKTSNVRGRGGAGFPIWFKLDAVRKAAGEPKFIVCNADEGDPGAFSDRYLMEERPYLVLVGMMMAGFIAGAEKGVIYIRAEYPESVEIINNAIVALAQAGLAGENILGSGFSFYFKLIKAQGAYICGEETALLQSIEGKRAEVRVRPPYPAQEGLFGKPTAVNNVETLAFLPYIIDNGGKAFSNLGTEKSTGTKLVSLDAAFNRPGLYEVEMGTPLAKVVETLGGGFARKTKALHIGGPLGGIVPVEKIPELTVDFESFQQNGFLLGHASVIGIPEDYPMVKYLEHLFEFTAHESCGKCFPCRLGSVRGAEMLQLAGKGEYKIDRELFNDLVDTLQKGSLCGLGGGIPLPVKNALQYFDNELNKYFR